MVEYREAEYRDYQFQVFSCHFGLDTAEKRRLLDQRTAFETNFQIANPAILWESAIAIKIFDLTEMPETHFLVNAKAHVR